MKINFTLILIFLSANLFAQFSQWQICNSGSSNIYNRALIGTSNVLLSTGIKSTDQGNTWTSLQGGIYGYSYLEVNGILFAGGAGEVYKSTDSGVTWTSIFNTGGINFIHSMTSINDSVYIATNGAGIWKSIDLGLTWINIANGLPTDSVRSIVSSGNDLILGTKGYGVYHSTDGGLSWVPKNSGLPLNSDVIEIIITNNRLIISTLSGVFFSDNLGLTWNQTLTSASKVQALFAYGNVVLAGGLNTSGNEGVFRSFDDGTTWSLFQDGLPNSCEYLVGAFGVTADYIFCAFDESLCPLDIYRMEIESVISSNETDPDDSKSGGVIFPNPFRDKLLFSGFQNQEHEITLYDSFGKMVCEQKITESFELNTKSLPSGFYVIRISDKARRSDFQKFVKN